MPQVLLLKTLMTHPHTQKNVIEKSEVTLIKLDILFNERNLIIIFLQSQGRLAQLQNREMSYWNLHISYHSTYA